MEVKYTDKFGKTITEEQSASMYEYKKQILVEGNIREEHVHTGRRKLIHYYSTTETHDEILEKYPEEEIYIHQDIQTVNGFTESKTDGYRKGQLIAKIVYVCDANDELVFESQLDIETGEHVQSKKYIYTTQKDDDGDRAFAFIFEFVDGELDAIWDYTGDFSEYIIIQHQPEQYARFSWQGIEEYQNLQPIIPSKLVYW